MQDILEESWAYQEIIGKGYKEGREEGREEGRQQGVLAMQQAAIGVVVVRFPDLETPARTKITAIDDMERLKQVIVDVALSRTREQMERVLLSLDT